MATDEALDLPEEKPEREDFRRVRYWWGVMYEEKRRPPPKEVPRG